MNKDIYEACINIKEELYKQDNVKKFFKLKKLLDDSKELNSLEMKANFYKTCDINKNLLALKYYNEREELLRSSNFKNIEEDVQNDINVLKDIIKQWFLLSLVLLRHTNLI